MEAHSVSRLIGAPPGYVGFEEGGQLTEALRRRPFRVVLFDEIEKAHPDVFNLLLQLLDDGRLTDSSGRTVDFTNTIVIMTSNIGIDEAEQDAIGFIRDVKEKDTGERLRASLNDSLKKSFRPEFLNRVDEIVVFDTIDQENLLQIVDIMLAEVRDRVDVHNIQLVVNDEAREWLAKEGFDPSFGARPLRRTIQRTLENPISTKILRGEFGSGDEVSITLGEDGLDFEVLVRN